MRDEDLKSYVIQADVEAVQAAQDLAEMRNAMKRHMARMAEFKEWVKAENIKNRQEQHEKAAAEALKNAGPPIKLLPVPDPLPREMQGQSPSTIQAMLRNGWRPGEE